VESVDGTHWFRFKDATQYCDEFIEFFENKESPQMELISIDEESI
jgi:hypothetical protein